ncbi:MAG TPA: hypothetical protein VK211_24425, partial [Kamptonema sp.]|nr:hypothetical protein [Kamptonema sp.]
MSLLRQIQDNSCNPDFQVADLLRQCKILAARLDYKPLKIWVENELNGYPDNESVPEYRIIKRVLLQGSFENGFRVYRNIPFRLNTKDKKKTNTILNTIYFIQGVSNLKSLVETNKSANTDKLSIPLSLDIASNLGMFVENLSPDYICISAAQVINVSSVVNMLDTIKTKILDFTLEIEAENSSAGDAKIGEKPVPEETLDKIFSITLNYHTGDNISYNGDRFTATNQKNMSDSKYDQRGASFPGGFAETNYGKMVETQYNIETQDLSQAAAEIQKILTQLQNHGGYSPEEAQKKIANDLVVEASSNPTAIKKLKDWGHTLSDT